MVKALSEKLFIIILTWNGKEHTREALRSIQKADSAFLARTIVLDNGSWDGTGPMVRGEFPSVIFLRNADNAGFARGNNQAIRYAIKRRAETIFLLNNDAVIEKDTIAELVAALSRHPKAAMVCPKIYFAKDGKKMIWYAGGEIDWQNIYGKHIGVDTVDRGQYDEEKETEFCTGAAIMLRVSALQKIGLFDERFFAYYEDSDLSIRAKKAGFELWYIPTATVFHKNAASSGGTENKLQDYFIPRNRLLFSFKHATWRTRFALVREAITWLFTSRRQGVIDFFFLRFGKGSCRLV